MDKHTDDEIKSYIKRDNKIDGIKKDILRTLNETCEISDTTSSLLVAQTEMINRADVGIDKIDNNLMVSENILQRMASFFVSLSPTKKIKQTCPDTIKQTCSDTKDSKTNNTNNGIQIGETKDDDFFGQLSLGIEKLKLQSLRQGDTIDLHNKQLDTIIKRTDNTNAKMDQLADTMKRIT